jgi:hypothetical protein
MNWHLPATVADMAAATRSVSSWRAQRFNLAADAVFVLSVSGMGLDRSHPLSDHVMTGAEREGPQGSPVRDCLLRARPGHVSRGPGPAG